MAGFEEFVAARSNALLRTAVALTGNEQDAQDLLQAALLRCYPRWRRIDDPEAYVRRVMINVYLTSKRRRWHNEIAMADLPNNVASIEDPVSIFDLRDSLISSLRALPPQQRAVLVLRYFEDLTVIDVAAILGVTTGTVKSQTSAALERIRSLTRGDKDGINEQRP